MALTVGRCAFAVCLALVLGRIGWSKDAAAYPSSPSTYIAAQAKQLVKQAIEAGLAGDQAKRQELLEGAIAADGNCELARWLHGQVNFNGQWQSPQAVGELVKSDPRWQQYRKLRQNARGGAADHAALARWCLKNGLAAQERFHWMVVLLQDPSHKQARQRLSLREYRGGLFTEKQIAEYELLEKQSEANLRKYKPKFIELVRQAQSESKSLRNAALAKIRAIDDLGAVAPLQGAIGRSGRDSSDPEIRDVNLALVAALSNMREHEATLNLLNYALFSTSEEVRTSSAAALKLRPATDYVPLLMGALMAPIEGEFDVVAAPDGTVRMIQTIYQAGPEGDVSHTKSTNYEVAGAFNRDRVRTAPETVLRNHLARARAQVEQTRNQVDSYNADAVQRNARIEEVLKTALGLDAGVDPEKYWAAWKDENELYYDEQPTYNTYEEESHTYVYAQAPSYTTVPTQAQRPAGRHYSCFAPGTPVWTQSGMRPIEDIVAGDIVLSQNPATGELAYRPVLQTTFGEPVPVLQIGLPDETITTTLGHRFWVNGQGWLMAKELKPAMALHAVGSGLDVRAVGKGDDVACHNLVVDEFHTFFVGKSQLLVHDISCPRPTTSTVPGAASLK